MDFTNIVHSQKAREAGMLTPKAKGDAMSQLKQRANVFFLHLSVLLRPSAEGMVPPHWRKQSSLLSPSIQMPVSSWDILPNTSRKNVSTWASLSPVKLTHKTKHHNHQTLHIYNMQITRLSFPPVLERSLITYSLRWPSQNVNCSNIPEKKCKWNKPKWSSYAK